MRPTIAYKLFCLLFLHSKIIDCGVVRKQLVVCSEVPKNELEVLLGPAYNPRYMSIKEPKPPEKASLKRNPTIQEEQFSVDENYAEELNAKPAWEVDNHVCLDEDHDRFRRDLSRQKPDSEFDENSENGTHTLVKRKNVDYVNEWHCKSKIIWTDLGPDYFPRYIRSVQCLSQSCWFGIFNCKPRSFTVKVLRRKRGQCVKSAKKLKSGVSGLPSELRQVWVWEEHALAFCCDCAR